MHSYTEETGMHKCVCLTTLVVAVLMAAVSVSFAGVLYEDVAYWYTDNGAIKTIFNPTSDVLNPLVSAGRVMVKVQETVYDPVFTQAMLVRNGDGAKTGYLYAYSITNINCGNPADLSDLGLTAFKPEWNIAPIYVTLSKQTPIGWEVDTSTASPSWKWAKTDPGLLPGETVGGFWAVSSVGVDGQIDGHVIHVGGLGNETFNGRTTGPVPDPPSILALMTGFIGLAGLKSLRRK